MARLYAIIPLVLMPLFWGMLQFAYDGVIENGIKLGWIATGDPMDKIRPMWESRSFTLFGFYGSLTATGVFGLLFLFLVVIFLTLLIKPEALGDDKPKDS